MREQLHTALPRTGKARKRVLVVNCYFDDSRQPIRRTTKIPQAVGPIYLAGAFARESAGEINRTDGLGNLGSATNRLARIIKIAIHHQHTLARFSGSWKGCV